MRSTKTLAAIVALTALLLAGATAGPAFAEAPWWRLSSGARPSYLHPGAARDEVQEVTFGERIVIVSPTLTEKEITEEEFFGPGQSTELTTATTAGEAQAGIEGLIGYGAGNVQVEQVDPTHYRVTFVGALADLPVALMREGYAGLGEITQVSAGAPDGEIYVAAENVGDANVDGGKSEVQLADVLPPGLRAVGIAGTKPFREGDFQSRELLPCSLATLTCTLSGTLAPFDGIEMRIAVVDEGAVSGGENEVSVLGGGAPSASFKRPVTISSAPVPFGVEDYEMALEEAGGSPTVQAGAHPFQLTTSITLNQNADLNPLVEPPKFKPEVTVPALAKDLSFKLPPGLIGNPTAIPQCTTAQFFETVEGKENKCPPQSAVGIAVATVHEPSTVGTVTLTEPIFNLEPRAGEPARFGFYVVLANSPVFIDTAVRTGSDYGVTVSVQNITQTAAFLSSQVTFWGVPGDPRHDSQRGWGCLYQARDSTPHPPCNAAEEQHPQPFLSLPTSCGAELQTSVEGDSWSAPGSSFSFTGRFEPASALVGCNQLQFAPEIEVKPDAQEASRPTGIAVDVHVPQEANENAQGLTSSNLRSVTVALPEGVTLNPSAAGWVKACSEGQIGFLGGRGPQEELLFTPTLPEPFCPEAAKVGTVAIKTPLLPAGQPLEGGLYLATPAPNGALEPGNNPFGSLLAMYIEARDPISGVLVKLPGSATLDPSTGRITATFQNTPDLSFEDAEIHLFAGERAPLASPATCGAKTTEATFTPWSGGAAVKSSTDFQITSGQGGGPCPAAAPFAPTLAAGTTNVNAGAFTPLSTTINRADGEQSIQSVQLHTPPGLSGILTGVTLCSEAQANAGTCPTNSLIGHSTVSVGVGNDPFTVTGGQVFLTQGYKGAPFGLSILTPAVAGPFNLGNVVVRAKIEVDPHTAALTVTTDQSGPYSIPHILDGIPLQIKHVNVTIDRTGFTFNPTNCSSQTFTGTIASAEGATAAVSSPFEPASCQALKFAPKFTVSTFGKNSKAGGAGLVAKLSYPKAAFGSQAELTRVKVDLPKQLPSRLTTLQKACTNAQFELNPANCPKASKIGYAKVSTPLLPVPLEGPAIFVSHGGEAFPSLTMVLQGAAPYNVTIDLVGTTFISSKGITSTTFKTVPDVPFNTFTLTLPQGKFSALTANVPAKAHYSLCGQTLAMPTEFLAQNGAKINQSTKISVTGCPPTRAKKKAHKAKRKKRKTRGK
jgi:hypothetical protein